MDIVAWHSQGKFTPVNLPMIMEVGKVRQATAEDDGIVYEKDRPHGISAEGMVEILKGLGDPAYIVYQANGRYAEIVRYRDKTGKTALASVDFYGLNGKVKYKYDQYMNGYAGGLYNVVVTTYNPEDLQSYLNNPDNVIIYDKKKGLPEVGSGSKLPSRLTDKPFYEDSVTQTEDGVKEKNSDRDSLTPEQQKHFDYNQKQEAVGSTLKTLKGSAIKRSTKYGVGKESGKVKMSEQDNPYHGKSLYRNAEVYDYDFMVSLQPMEVLTMPSLASVKTGDRVDQKKAVSLGLKNAEEVGRVAENGSYAITNVYTGREIHLGQHGLEHSLGGNDVARLRTNARLSAIGGLIVQNAVPINGLTNKNRQANGTYAFACLLKSGNRYVVAIVTVEEHSSTAVDIDYVDISHSISGRLVKNKEDSRSSTRETGYVLSEAPATTAFKVSIADFLEIVNETYRSILSADVLKHFGAERPADGYYSDRVLFSDRDTAPTFYSHMARVVDDVKQEKLGAASVVSMLRGKVKMAERDDLTYLRSQCEARELTRNYAVRALAPNEMGAYKTGLDRARYHTE